MKNDVRLSLRRLLTLTGTLLVAVVVNGCLAGSGPGQDSPAATADEGKIQPQAGVRSCCEHGYWSCSKAKSGGGSREFDYYVPQTCGLTWLQAKNLCTTECAVSCTDSGWDDEC